MARPEHSEPAERVDLNSVSSLANPVHLEASRETLATMAGDDDSPAVLHSEPPPRGEPNSIPQGIAPVSFVTEQISFIPGRFFLDLCAGATRPLSSACHAKGLNVFSFDILLDSSLDILCDGAYEQLLRVCSSGQVAYAAGSPSCNQYSRLKLRNDGGPRALRTPDHLDGVPGLSPDEVTKLQESFIMLSRVVNCLRLVFLAGGHVHLEQPQNAMSWLEPVVQKFLKLISASCVCIAACHHGMDIAKSWIFATSFSALRSLACTCTHSPGSHTHVQGTRDSTGQFLSRVTACYPASLADVFASTVEPLISKGQWDLNLHSASATIPWKMLGDFPKSFEDGGGIISHPDWSDGPRLEFDCFRSLRQKWLQRIVQSQMHKQVLAHFTQAKSDPPFTADQLVPFRTDLTDWLTANHRPIDWTVRDRQPMHLAIMAELSAIMQDADIHLFPSLQAGVSTGFLGDIPPSHVFPPAEKSQPDLTPLSVHMTNWQSAETDIDLTRSLVQEEVDKGWVFEFPGDLAQAQAEYPTGVSVGKLGVALSDNRPPRLVVDSSICGLNNRCTIPEKSTLPTAKDVLRCFPLRQTSAELMGLSLDIKSAHKRVVLRESEWGLVGFSLEGKLFFYRVCPFGAVFSAAWWSRLGGWLLRCMHHFLWFSHAAFLYVDDFLFFQDGDVMPISAAMLCILCQVLNIPISWRKCELSKTISWIGWRFHFKSGFIEIPEEKLDKIRKYVKELLATSRTSRKLLEKFIGLAMWLTQLFPYMRIWLHYLYKDLYSIPATHFSIDPDDWMQVPQCLSSTLCFSSRPRGTAIPVGSTLISVKHQPVSTLEDVRALRLSDRRIWMRIRDPNSSRRHVSSDSHRILSLFSDWLNVLPPVRSMFPKPLWPGEAAADACAAGTECQIGGFIRTSDGQTKWFSERFTTSDFDLMKIPTQADLQRNITCFETLAQMALLYLVSRTFPGFRLPLRIKTLSDNTGAEAGSNRLFTTSFPQCLFLEKLCLLAACTCAEIDVSHISGSDNEIADALSRWDLESAPPYAFDRVDRISIPLDALWTSPLSVSLHPADAHIVWSLPK